MFRNIIIPIDLADKTSITTILPIALSYVTNFDAKLHFVHIISDFGMKMIEDYLPKHWITDQKDKYKEQLEELISQYVPNEIVVEKYIGRGSIYDEVIQYANRANADLIIVSAVRPQLRDYMLGSNASKIVRHAEMSVLVVR